MTHEQVNLNIERWKELLGYNDAESGGIVSRIAELQALADLLHVYTTRSGDVPNGDTISTCHIAQQLGRAIKMMEEDLDSIIKRNIAEIKAEATEIEDDDEGEDEEWSKN